MKNLYLALPEVFFVLLFMGCSPKVYTNIQTRYPANPPQSEVAVYDTLQPIPSGAQVLGDVGVVDMGLTGRFRYPQVVEIAVDETNKIGGNALKIVKHIPPSFNKTSSHQIWGQMLRLYDSLDTTPSIAPPPTPEYITITQLTTVHFTPGYAFLISNYIIPEEFSGRLQQGLHLDGGVDRVSPSGFGGGVRYLGYLTSGSYRGRMPGETFTFNSNIHYLAMEFVVRRQTRSGKWGLNTSAGFGMAYSSQKINGVVGGTSGLAGYGFHITLGGEYRISRNIGIGIQSTLYKTLFSRDDADIMCSASSSHARNTSFSFISINGGIRFHF